MALFQSIHANLSDILKAVSALGQNLQELQSRELSQQGHGEVARIAETIGSMQGVLTRSGVLLADGPPGLPQFPSDPLTGSSQSPTGQAITARAAVCCRDASAILFSMKVEGDPKAQIDAVLTLLSDAQHSSLDDAEAKLAQAFLRTKWLENYFDTLENDSTKHEFCLANRHIGDALVMCWIRPDFDISTKVKRKQAVKGPMQRIFGGNDPNFNKYLGQLCNSAWQLFERDQQAPRQPIPASLDLSEGGGFTVNEYKGHLHITITPGGKLAEWNDASGKRLMNDDKLVKVGDCKGPALELQRRLAAAQGITTLEFISCSRKVRADTPQQGHTQLEPLEQPKQPEQSQLEHLEPQCAIPSPGVVSSQPTTRVRWADMQSNASSEDGLSPAVVKEKSSNVRTSNPHEELGKTLDHHKLLIEPAESVFGEGQIEELMNSVEEALDVMLAEFAPALRHDELKQASMNAHDAQLHAYALDLQRIHEQYQPGMSRHIERLVVEKVNNWVMDAPGYSRRHTFDLTEMRMRFKSVGVLLGVEAVFVLLRENIRQLRKHSKQCSDQKSIENVITEGLRAVTEMQALQLLQPQHGATIVAIVHDQAFGPWEGFCYSACAGVLGIFAKEVPHMHERNIGMLLDMSKDKFQHAGCVHECLWALNECKPRTRIQKRQCKELSRAVLRNADYRTHSEPAYESNDYYNACVQAKKLLTVV